jgi:hypothetical protein
MYKKLWVCGCGVVDNISGIFGSFGLVVKKSSFVQKIYTGFYVIFDWFYICYGGSFPRFPHRYTTTTNILLR